MNTSYDTTNLSKTVFNPDDFMSNGYISKAEADTRYINSSQNLETLIGSLNISGDGTVTNQYVTGNTVIQGNLTSGQSGFDGPGHSTTVIKGDVTLGTEGNYGTKVKMPGEVAIGWAQPINIRGSEVNINVLSNSGPTLIGRNATDLTIRSKTKIENQTIEAGVIGDNTKMNVLKGSSEIGTVGGVTSTTIKGTFWAGDNTNQIALAGNSLSLNASGYTALKQGNMYMGSDNFNTTYLAGKTLIGTTQGVDVKSSDINYGVKINTASDSTHTFIGKTGLAVDATTQKNVLLSGQN